MTMDATRASELLREWDFHNTQHRCYYEEYGNSALVECPSNLPNLRAFLEGNGFPVEKETSRILGRDLNEPGFRSRNSGKETPVKKVDIDHPKSIRELREDNELRPVESIRYEVLDEGPRNASEKDENAHLTDSDNPWEVEAMGYFKGRLDKSDEQLHNIGMVMVELSESLKRIEDALAERSEAKAEIGPIEVTVTGVPVDMTEDLERDLRIRVASIIAHRRTIERR